MNPKYPAQHQTVAETPKLDRTLILLVVESSDKKRFTISDDGNHIRAYQGHSITVDLQLIPKQPPDVLYHGTASRFLDSIKKEGLKSGQRQHVHLSEDKNTAMDVGQRYGKPILLTIDSRAMFQQGTKFFQAENGVWLTHHIPAYFIRSD